MKKSQHKLLQCLKREHRHDKYKFSCAFWNWLYVQNTSSRVWEKERARRTRGGEEGGIYYLKENNKNQLLNYSLVCQKCV